MKINAIHSNTEQPNLKAACQDMEAVFLKMLMDTMDKTVNKSSLLGQSQGESIMRSMLNEETAKNVSKAGGIGLADMLYRQLKP